MQICADRACNGFAAQIRRGADAFILGIHAECLGRAAIHVQHLDICIICGRKNDRGCANGIQHLYISGCQCLCLVCAGGDFCIFHLDAVIRKGFCENAFLLFHDRGQVQGRGDIGEGQRIERGCILCGAAACQRRHSQNGCHCHANQSFFHL